MSDISFCAVDGAIDSASPLGLGSQNGSEVYGSGTGVNPSSLRSSAAGGLVAAIHSPALPAPDEASQASEMFEDTDPGEWDRLGEILPADKAQNNSTPSPGHADWRNGVLVIVALLGALLLCWFGLVACRTSGVCLEMQNSLHLGGLSEGAAVTAAEAARVDAEAAAARRAAEEEAARREAAAEAAAEAARQEAARVTRETAEREVEAKEKAKSWW